MSREIEEAARIGQTISHYKILEKLPPEAGQVGEGGMGSDLVAASFSLRIAQPLKVMNRFKQKTGYWLSKNDMRAQWQKDHSDHIIRKEEDILKYIRYILDNPVRKGIVTNRTDYPFKGSTALDLNGELF